MDGHGFSKIKMIYLMMTYHSLDFITATDRKWFIAIVAMQLPIRIDLVITEFFFRHSCCIRTKLVLSPLQNDDRVPFQTKLATCSLFIHTDACKAQEIGGSKNP